MMFSRIRRRLTVANIVMTLALVFAMTGGAYAAKRYLITSTKQISPKVLKVLEGKNGKDGAPGATGSAGASGSQGLQGPQGPEGKAGKDGSNGESVASKEVKTTEAECNKLGGSSFTVAGKTEHVCNGSPWVVGGLPKGASERGTWSVSGSYKANDFVFVPMSFAVPVAEPLSKEKVHFIALGEGEGEGKEASAITQGECTGTFEHPGAAEGQLCMFASLDGSLLGQGGLQTSPSIDDPETRAGGAGVSGAYLLATASFTAPATEGSVLATGDWVVTAG